MSEVTIESPDLTVTVSDLGAETQRIVTASGEDLLWNGDAAYWTGRAPILFPIVGRAPGDRIAVDGREAEMRQHGFARRMRFALEAAGADFCRHVLTDSEETRAAYPFAFRLALTHALDGATLRVTAEVSNRSAAAMPFGLGFHPAFLWPLPGAAGRVHAITLENRAEPPLARLEGGFLAPGLLPSPFARGRLELDPSLFDTDALVLPEGAGDALTYAAEGAGPVLRFGFENTPNLGIWTKPGGAPYICVEPWHGMAAELGKGREIADRPGSVTLAPGASERFGYSVSVG